jgi:hypothetical protein
MLRRINALRALVAAIGLLGPVEAAFAQDTGFGTPEDQKNLIAGLCSVQLNIGPAGCTCLAERALTELDEPQRSYLIMSVVQPPAAERLPIAKSKEQLATIFGFLEKASGECRQGAPAAPPAPAAGEEPKADVTPAQ